MNLEPYKELCKIEVDEDGEIDSYEEMESVYWQ